MTLRNSRRIREGSDYKSFQRRHSPRMTGRINPTEPFQTRDAEFTSNETVVEGSQIVMPQTRNTHNATRT
ncbi:hypothetical protein Hamer_G002499 [Homarus americanus]|uniref:Uncharacterized protein n=1 Tax=Homarus americanus TaxID=6706 RepID=A0A8J5K2N6_HOMAM|nr:hypothetical protein Hamer_G002499 [Homarus americanus]